jgi:hypothetical protein
MRAPDMNAPRVAHEQVAVFEAVIMGEPAELSAGSPEWSNRVCLTDRPLIWCVRHLLGELGVSPSQVCAARVGGAHDTALLQLVPGGHPRVVAQVTSGVTSWRLDEAINELELHERRAVAKRGPIPC